MCVLLFMQSTATGYEEFSDEEITFDDDFDNQEVSALYSIMLILGALL